MCLHLFVLLYQLHNKQVITPWAEKTICPPPPPMAVRLTADLRPSAFFDGWPAAGSQRAYSLGWDRQTDRQADGSRYCLVTPYGAGHNNNCAFCVGNFKPRCPYYGWQYYVFDKLVCLCSTKATSEWLNRSVCKMCAYCIRACASGGIFWPTCCWTL